MGICARIKQKGSAMADLNQKVNMPTEKSGSKKALVIAVSVICALLAVIIVFLACKNTIYFEIAKAKTESGDYYSALALCEQSSGDKNDALEEYLKLRAEINEFYPQLLLEFDINKINEWKERTSMLGIYSDILGEQIISEAQNLFNTLSQISSLYSQYISMRPDILSLMEVFTEFNRLYTVDASGKNTAFTVSSELSKISGWEQLNSNLTVYASSIPGSESVYLLNYLIKEVQAECGELRQAMDSVIAMGYTQTDNIRLSGTAQKKFPSIQNSENETVSVAEKERYEAFMFDGICHKLAENLGAFYSV